MTKSNLIVLTITLASLATSTANAQLYLSSSSYYPKQPTTVYSNGGVELSSSGGLTIEGTDDHDTCRLWLTETKLWVGLSIPKGSTKWHAFEEGTVKRIEFFGNDGDDAFYIQHGSELMNYGLHQFSCDLYGGWGLDYLSGGAGNDILDGGWDKSDDVLIGNDGADRFVRHYLAKNDGTYQINYETIIDASYAEGDRLVYEQR